MIKRVYTISQYIFAHRSPLLWRGVGGEVQENGPIHNGYWYYFLLLISILLFNPVFSQTYCSGTISLTASSAAFSDGSGSNNYADNSDCFWLIQPPGAATISLRFTTVDLELYQCSDKVRIYDGVDTLANQIAVVCGNTLPSTINSTGGALLVRFTSDISYNFSGWDANYNSNMAPPVYCSGTLTMVTASGSFDDGSGPSNYNDNSNCKWLIKPTGANSVTLSFTSFNTQLGHDFLKVYEDSLTGPMVGSFSGNTLPQQLVLPTGTVFLNFTSDNSGTDLGWTASYTSTTPVGINEKETNKLFSLFPNPFHQTATLKFSVPEPETSELQITDVCGKVLKTISIPSLTSSLQIDMATVPNGMYLYHISKKNCTVYTGKMIVE